MNDATPFPKVRAKRRSSGEWDVVTDQGKQLATGFDTEAEADEWIKERAEDG